MGYIFKKVAAYGQFVLVILKKRKLIILQMLLDLNKGFFSVAEIRFKNNKYVEITKNPLLSKDYKHLLFLDLRKAFAYKISNV